jgi:hypothetical protein
VITCYQVQIGRCRGCRRARSRGCSPTLVSRSPQVGSSRRSPARPGARSRPTPRSSRGSRRARSWRRMRPAGASQVGGCGCGHLPARAWSATASQPAVASRMPPRCWGRASRGCWSVMGGRRTASSSAPPTRPAWRTYCAAAVSCRRRQARPGRDPARHPPHPQVCAGGPGWARRRRAGPGRCRGRGWAAGRPGRQAHRRSDGLSAQPAAAGPSGPRAGCAVHLPHQAWGAGDQLARRARHPPRCGPP